MKKKFILGAVLLLAQKNYAAINKNRIEKKLVNSVLVAVIDTGADIQHKSLQKFIWINEGESGLDQFGHDKATNKIDDDGNGFVDDVHGWNFVDNNNDLSDQQGHGTHIAGIIKSEFSSHSTSTLSKDVRLMILRYYNPEATDNENIVNTVKAINYATQMKARLINYSGGGSQPSPSERQAIERARDNNVIFVAAAGNNRSDTDFQKYYPASYNLENIISVAATDNEGALENFSNYGKEIDIAAPGKSVYSTLPHNAFGFMSGTSQATAYVTGVAASLVAEKSGMSSPQNVLTELLSTSRFNKSLLGKTKFQLAMVSSAK